jgi:hypothetical protein
MLIERPLGGCSDEQKQSQNETVDHQTGEKRACPAFRLG